MIRHREIIAIDISEAGVPSERWRREFLGRAVALAPDASAYVASHTPDPKGEQWQTTVTWVAPQRAPVTLPDTGSGVSEWSLSSGGNFFAEVDFRTRLAVTDLRSGKPVRYDQNDVGFGRYGCVNALLPTGHIVVEDERTPRFGVYAPSGKVPRVATLPHLQDTYCTLLSPAAADGKLFVLDGTRGVHALNLARVDAPSFAGFWQIPPRRGLPQLQSISFSLRQAASLVCSIFRGTSRHRSIGMRSRLRIVRRSSNIERKRFGRNSRVRVLWHRRSKPQAC
jgi:hypothetical protein